MKTDTLFRWVSRELAGSLHLNISLDVGAQAPVFAHTHGHGAAGVGADFAVLKHGG